MLLLLVGFVSLQAQNNYGIGEGFDPANPGNPDAPATTYTLRAEASPRNGGSLSISSDEVESGATVWLYAYNNSNYRFEKWVENGETVSTASSFEYTMPARDVTLTAVFVFDPENPANPDTLAIKHNVTVVAEPQSGGSFNFSNSEFTQGQEVSLYAYPSTNYEFNGWQVDGKTVSMSQPYTFIPTGNVRVTGLFTFNPSNPSNPGRNSFNQETGELILDDFEPGYIMNAVDEAIGGSGNRGRVTMVTVSGRMESYDFGIANYLSACTYFDFSRTFGYTEVPSYAFDGTGVTSVILPSCVENIGYGAFMDCQMLTELSLYSVTPPSLQNSVFSGVPDGLVVRVLSNAIPLYSENESWSGYTLLPLTAEVRTLEVSLPAEAADGRYKDMSLELVNSASGQTQKYVVSDRISYTFYGLIKNSEFNVYLKNSVGSVLGTIEGVKVVDEDVKTAFETILTPKDVTLAVVTADGTDVTAQTKIEWTRADGTYLAQGNAVSGLTDGTELAYRVTLDRTLGMQCVEPGKHDFTVGEENAITLTLQPIKQVALGGVVKDEDGQPMSGVTVAVTQQLNGKYSKAFSVSTGSDGAFNLQVYGEPSSISASYTDYITQTLSTDTLTSDTNVGTITMREITGARISTNLTFTPSVAEGETAETQSWYDDYANIEYSVYNKTAGKAVSQFSVQYPTIALIDETSPGDVLEITARSKTGAFMPVTVEATPIDEQNNAEATIAIVELGGISASFSSTDNSAVVGLLYDANGRLVKKYSYSTASLTISGLQDGDYTLVTMANSNLFSGLSMLSQYETAGLVVGTDYVSNSVTVTSGCLATVANDVVPTLDESKLYYTGDKTMASVNKTSIVAGNYLTLRGVVDFKQEFAGSVSDAKLVMDLPDNTTFVENSVMVGSNIAGYSLDGDHLVIPLNGSTEQVRFCVIPELGGTYSPSLFAEFTVNGQTVTQPIGSVNYEVKDLSISVPKTVAKTSVSISGTAKGNSTVTVYDNGVVIGTTTTLANGNWSTTCELNEPYNLSTHPIYAKVITTDGLELQSETKEAFYDKNAIEVSKVTMFHYNPEVNGWKGNTYESVFDFQNPSMTPNKWIVYYPNKEFTYTIEFTNNSPDLVSNVILYVHTAGGEIFPYPATYDEKKDLWVVECNLGSSSDQRYPVNVSVDFTTTSTQMADRNEMDSNVAELENMLLESVQEREDVLSVANQVVEDDILCLEIDKILEADEIDDEMLMGKLSALLADAPVETSMSHDDLMVLYEKQDSIFEVKQSYAVSMVNEVVDEVYIDPSFNLSDDFVFSQTMDTGVKVCEKKTLPTINENELEENGFYKFGLTDSSFVYYRYTEDCIEVVDSKTKVSYKVTINAEGNQRMSAKSVSPDMVGYVECGKRVVNLMKEILTFNDDNSKTAWMNRVKLVSEFINAIQCYYDGYRSELEYSFNQKQTARELNFTTQISDNQNLKKSIEGSLSRYNNELESLHQRRVELIDLRDVINNDASLTEEIKNARLEALENELDVVVDRQFDVYDFIKKEERALNKVKKNIGKLENQLDVVRRSGDIVRKALEKCPLRLVRGVKIPPVLRVSGKVAGAFGVVLQVACLFVDAVDTYDDLCAWSDVMDGIDRKIPCPANPDEALELQQNIYSSAWSYTGHHIAILSGEVGAIGFSAAGGVFLSPTWWTEMVISAICEWAKLINTNSSLDSQTKYWIQIASLKCDEEPDPEPDDGVNNPNNNGGNGGSHKSNQPNDEVEIDPSGYVYEAVSSNRLEGVTATCYYKEMVEDMYGDLHENVVLWDAAEYAQENPLFTDENGMYRWDVPQGLWQVKFEKEGYQTTYSEWLPVPPPQLEVNIAMTQDRQPEVKAAVAYEDGLEVEFDKYMQPETMTTENIFATKDGVTVEGSIVMKNEEQAYGDGSESYVSRVRFVPTTPFFTGDKVTLTVSRRVKSYAGIQMETDYSQQFDIVKEVKEIASDSLLRVPYTGERELRVSVLPFDAAVGRTLRAKSSSEMIAVVTPEAVLDENGQATLRVSGELPGSAVITFTVDGVDATATTTVKVAADYYDVVTPTPTASRISGTEVYKGTEITLTCEDTDAVIYYTTDGSCPCDEQSRKEYTEPIVVDADMTLKAVAISDGKEESDVAEFTYKLKRTATAMKLKKGWNWLSHNLDEPVTPETLAGGATEAFVGSDGNVSGETLAAQSYKAKVAEDRSFTMEGVQVNPGNVAINLRSGWNWIGFPVGQAMSVTEAMTDATPDNYDCIVGQEGFAQYAGDAWQGTLDVMRPGQGYMYLSGSDKSFTYFTDIVSKANSLYQTGEDGDAVWTADAYAYPDVMCFVAQLYDGDVEAEEGKYVVGAFSGDECRGVGSFAEGRLCISVAGEDGDAIRFIAFDVDSERSYNVDETFSFSQSVQGNFDLPQALHIGDVLTGINSVTARDDFGATITDGKLRITLDGPIDGVALISADGMCVLKSGWDTGAVYKDVSMIPDGVYILLVESEGKMYHKKIVKKP